MIIESVERALNKSSLFYAAIIISCLILIGVPLLFHPASDINPDSYQYLSIAQYYLLDPSPSIRDAYTVGPVIPILIAIFKYSLSAIFEWNRHADIFLLKGLALLSYMVIVISAGAYLKRTVTPLVVFVFLLLFMGLPHWELDSLSLNGELVSVAWLTLLLAYLNNENRAPNVFVVSLLAVLVIYTKLQSAILLSLLLASFYYDKKDKWLALFVFVGCAILVESVLYANGTGLVYRANDLLMYAMQPGAAKGIHTESLGLYHSLRNSRYIHNLPWAVAWVQKFVPLFGFVVIYLLLSNQNRMGGILSDWRVWLLATFITILTPGRQFGHYVLYAMLFVVVFAMPVLGTITTKIYKKESISLISLIIIITLFAINTAKSSRPIESTKLWLGPDIEAAVALTKKDGGRVHIHGWDYRLYTYFYGWNDGTDLSYVTLGGIDPSWYLNRIRDKQYKYIIDVVGHSGLISDPSYQITDSTVYGEMLSENYDLVLNKNGLRVFQIKNKSN